MHRLDLACDRSQSPKSSRWSKFDVEVRNLPSNPPVDDLVPRLIGAGHISLRGVFAFRDAAGERRAHHADGTPDRRQDDSMPHGQPFGRDALLALEPRSIIGQRIISQFRDFASLRPRKTLVKNRRLSLTLITALFLQ